MRIGNLEDLDRAKKHGHPEEFEIAPEKLVVLP